MKRFDWDSCRQVIDLMIYYDRKFSQWSEVRRLSDDEFSLWISLHHFLNNFDWSRYNEVKNMLRNYCLDEFISCCDDCENCTLFLNL